MDPQGHRSRLRERFFNAGLEAFAPHEVLELLLTFAIPRRDTKPLAYALITKFGSLHAVLQASAQELMTVNGIGENAATLISMIAPLFRAYHQSIEKELPTLKNLEQCARYCKGLFIGERFEKLYVICLDSRMRRLNTILISSGDVSEVYVYSRHIINAISRCNATGVIITHNHPGGTAVPSNEDIALTDAITVLLKGIDVILYDHIIISPIDTFNFRSAGLLDHPQQALIDAAQHPERLLPIQRIKKAYKGENTCRENGDFLE